MATKNTRSTDSFLTQVLRAMRYASGKRMSEAAFLRSRLFQTNYQKHRRRADNWELFCNLPELEGYARLGPQGLAYEIYSQTYGEPVPPLEAPGEYRPCAATSAAIETLGQCAIASAQKHLLSPELHALAREFRLGTARVQREVLRKLYQGIRNRDVESILDEEQRKPVIEHGFGSMFEDYYHQTVNRMFPFLIHSLKEKANCFGMAIRLLAFARECGAKAFFASPVTSGHQLCSDTVRSAQAMLMMTAMCHRMLPETELDSWNLSFQNSRVLSKLWASNFHAGVVMQLDDGSWFLVDPYLGSWGEVPNFEIAASTLELYSAISPGFTLFESAAAQASERVKAELQSHLLMGKAAVELGSQFADEVNEAIDQSSTGTVNVSDVSVLLSRSALFSHFCDVEGVTEEDFEAFGGADKLALFVLGGASHEGVDQLFADNECFVRAIDTIRRYPLDAILQKLRVRLDELCDEGRVIHPFCEYSQPAHEVGIRLLRELALSNGQDLETLRILTTESSSQLAVHDGIVYFDSEISAQLAGAFPAVHDSVRDALEGSVLQNNTPEEQRKVAEWLSKEAQKSELISLQPC